MPRRVGCIGDQAIKHPHPLTTPPVAQACRHLCISMNRKRIYNILSETVRPKNGSTHEYIFILNTYTNFWPFSTIVLVSTENLMLNKFRISEFSRNCFGHTSQSSDGWNQFLGFNSGVAWNTGIKNIYGVNVRYHFEI